MKNKYKITEMDRVKLFGMKNLMLENDLIKLEDSGIDLEHKKTLLGEGVVDVELFELDILKSAKKMADFYVLYYGIENTIRRLINGRLKEKYGADWWDHHVPPTLQGEVEKRIQKERDSVMSMRSDDPLTYTTLGELIEIFKHNWVDFSDTIRSQKALIRVLSQLNQLRGIVAHSCELPEDEIERFEITIKDWFRIQT